MVQVCHALIGGLCGLIDLFLLEVDAYHAGIGVRRLRIILQKFLVLGQGGVELTLAVEQERRLQRAGGNG